MIWVDRSNHAIERDPGLHNLKRLTLFLQDVNGVCSPHVCWWICLVVWWSGEYAASRVSLSSFPGALHCAGDSMGGDLNTWWGDVWNEVQTVFLTLILDRMHHRGTYRVLVWHANTILLSAFGKSMEFCLCHRSVNYPAGPFGKRFNFIIIYIIHHIEVLGYGRQITWWIVITKKMRGHSGKQFARKSRNNCQLNGRDCGCTGKVDSRHNFAQS